MKNEINLLPPKKRLSEKDSKQIRTLHLATLGSLLIIVSLSVGVFLMTALSPLDNLKKEEAKASADLDTLRPKAAKYLITQKRLGDIQGILASRQNYAGALVSMEQDEPQEISFDGISLEGNTVTLIASSTSLEAINSFLQSLQQKTATVGAYHNLVLSKMEYDSTGQKYNTSVTVTLP